MEIRSYESVGNLRFSDSRQTIRGLLGNRFESFYKGPVANIITDSYDHLGLHLYFDKDDRLNFVEAFQPAKLTFHGIELLGRSIEEVDADLRAMGHIPEPLKAVDAGPTYLSAGIALTVDESVVEGVAVFGRNYDPEKEYQEELAKLKEKYEATHPQRTVEPKPNETPAAEMRYCWRCREEVPMLNDAADAELQAMWAEACETIARRKLSAVDSPEEDSKQPEMEAFCRRYWEITGKEWKMRHLTVYHRIADYGPPCIHCGKPLRTHNATTCLECGHKQK